jgi:hypothetical protein
LSCTLASISDESVEAPCFYQQRKWIECEVGREAVSKQARGSIKSAQRAAPGKAASVGGLAHGLTIVKACQYGSNRGNFSKASSNRITASWSYGKGDRQIEALFALGSRERGTRSPSL